MPCDIGVRSYSKIAIPAPQPMEFRTASEAPQIDAELLDRLGVEDPAFLEWARDLNARPLLEEALKRMRGSVSTSGIDFVVNDRGMLEARGSFTSTAEKSRLSRAAAKASNRWQFEILAIVTQLLDYVPTVTENGDELVLEASESGKAHPCDYIKITRKGDVTDIVFEHFKTKGALDLATAKFLALADRLGVKIALNGREIVQGDSFPVGVTHDHGHTHAHGHKH